MSKFEWKDFIQISNEWLLHSSNPREEVLRSAVSRAYYGIFKTIEDYLTENEIDIDKLFPNVGSHDKVINYLLTIDQQFSNNLDFLKRERVKADYNKKASFTFKKSKYIIEFAMKSLTAWNNVKKKIQP